VRALDHEALQVGRELDRAPCFELRLAQFPTPRRRVVTVCTTLRGMERAGRRGIGREKNMA
jgi:hypothetical protein